MQKEIWKDIPNYEGRYQVSNFGIVKSLDREVIIKGRSKRIHKAARKGVVLSPRLTTSGYLSVSLGVEKKCVSVHQLVAMAFLGHVPNGHKMVVDHIDENKLNNNVLNLQLITHRENCTRSKKRKHKYIGAYLDKRTGRWKSSIRIKGKLVYLGMFNTDIEAYTAYMTKLNELER